MYIIIPFLYKEKLYTCSVLRRLYQEIEKAGTRSLLCYMIPDHSNWIKQIPMYSLIIKHAH